MVYKWHHYFDSYDRNFSQFRNRDITMFDIGVYQGRSLGMWRNYFGQQAQIIGIDLDPACADRASDGVHIDIGDQSDPAFRRRVVEKYGAPDIVLDDGGHTAHQQITSFEILYPHLKLPGVYLVEDTHTAFWNGS